MNHTTTDCRSETGTRVGILDAIVTLCRCLPHGGLTDPAVEEALRDIAHDEDFARLLYIVASVGNVAEWKAHRWLAEIRSGIAAHLGRAPCYCFSTDACECEEARHRSRNEGRNPEFPVEPCECACHPDEPHG